MWKKFKQEQFKIQSFSADLKKLKKNELKLNDFLFRKVNEEWVWTLNPIIIWWEKFKERWVGTFHTIILCEVEIRKGSYQVIIFVDLSDQIY